MSTVEAIQCFLENYCGRNEVVLLPGNYTEPPAFYDEMYVMDENPKKFTRANPRALVVQYRYDPMRKRWIRADLNADLTRR